MSLFQNTSFKIAVYSFLLILLINGCSIFFDEKLEEELITLLAPSDYLETTETNQTFNWTGIEGATAYQLMIVKPTFDAIAKIVLDSSITGTSFTYNLSPGEYQWGVYAYNNSSTTPQSFRDLTILDTTSQQKDLSEVEVILLSPADNSTSYSTLVNFYWEAVDSAKGYIVKIAKPDFETLEEVVLDSITTHTSFSKRLPVGNYQWYIKAYNDNNSTEESIRNLTVNTDYVLDGNKVILETPLEDNAFNAKSISLKWKAITGADSYLVEVHKADWDGDNVIYPTSTSDTSLKVSLNEGTYAWGVKAQNDYSESVYGTATFVVDLTAPDKPSLTQPLNAGDTIKTSPYQLKWTHPTESLSALYDSLFIAKDSLFTTQLTSVFIKEETSYSLYDFANGKWYCKVKSVDKAGNEGEYSVTKSFILSK